MTDRPVAGHDVVDSPLGPITLVADADGALCGLYFPEHRHGPSAEAVGPRQAGVLAEVADQLDEYFHEGRRRFDVVVAPPGTPSAFRREVWAHLATIPYGETVSYGELAVRLGRPGAARAVGLANGANPVSIIVPCHRVIGASGSLTGYGGGMARKRALLDHEAGDGRPRLF